MNIIITINIPQTSALYILSQFLSLCTFLLRHHLSCKQAHPPNHFHPPPPPPPQYLIVLCIHVYCRYLEYTTIVDVKLSLL